MQELKPNLTCYADAQEYQLNEWVAGRPWHNPFDPSGSTAHGGECCPDFSCCHPELLAPTNQREAFARATDIERSHMLGMFLVGLVQEKAGDTPVIVIDGTDDGKRQ